MVPGTDSSVISQPN